MDSITFQDLNEDMKLLLYFIVLAVLSLFLGYVLTVRKTLKLVAPENRFMSPNQSLLLLVPIFNIYWQFEVANKLSDSLTNEFYDRKVAEEENPGRAVGRVLALLNILIVIPLAGINMAFGLAHLIYFIYYWVKVNQFRNLLIDHNRYLEEKRRKQQHEIE